ncbi:MAG: MarR family transcriptional regulator [Dysgonamonadaceae bacterium]|jgi:DNA-binding MarR family transcriptional regulator|nr:MarR family transcriptional regulator [Dysgonamonadaceae bacterium]
MENDLKEKMVKFTRLISAAEENAKEQCEKQDLTTTQLNYLEIIGELVNPTITELASVMGLTKPSVTIVVDRLISKGFVRKVHSDIDKRSSHLHLTELGEQINKWHDYAHDYMINLIAGKLDKNEVKLFSQLLGKITETKK